MAFFGTKKPGRARRSWELLLARPSGARSPTLRIWGIFPGAPVSVEFRYFGPAKWFGAHFEAISARGCPERWGPGYQKALFLKFRPNSDHLTMHPRPAVWISNSVKKFHVFHLFCSFSKKNQKFISSSSRWIVIGRNIYNQNITKNNPTTLQFKTKSFWVKVWFFAKQNEKTGQNLKRNQNASEIEATQILSKPWGAL